MVDGLPAIFQHNEWITCISPRNMINVQFQFIYMSFVFILTMTWSMLHLYFMIIEFKASELKGENTKDYHNRWMQVSYQTYDSQLVRDPLRMLVHLSTRTLFCI